MWTEFFAWIVRFFSPRHRDYDAAQRLYDDYARQIALPLTGPSPAQQQAARQSDELDDSLQIYQEVLTQCERAGDSFNVAVTRYQMALVHRLRGHWDLAAPLFRAAIAGLEALRPSNPRVQYPLSLCHFYLGQVCLEQGENAEARRCLQVARDIDHLLGDTNRTVALTELLARV